MAGTNHIKNVAIVGATGNLGSYILSALLAKNQLNITAITRSSTTTPLPSHPSLRICRGSYDDLDFLLSSLAEQEVLIIVLAFMAPADLEGKLVDAAAKAGIKWILPTEFGSDNANPKMLDAVPMNATKTPVREKIESLGSKWVGIATNPWFTFSLNAGYFGIDVPGRKATLYSGGRTRFNTTNMSTVGRAVASLLTLPITSQSGASLSDYANGYVYISSFLTTQREILAACQRVSNTSDSEWEIREDSAPRWIEEGGERLAKGDFYGGINLLYGQLFIEGSGSNYESTKGLANKVLGLPEENMYESIEAALAIKPV